MPARDAHAGGDAAPSRRNGRGGLRERFDVVLFPDTWRGLKDIATGIDPKFSPLAYTKTPEFPTHGAPSS